jgi:hypothetical protein
MPCLRLIISISLIALLSSCRNSGSDETAKNSAVKDSAKAPEEKGPGVSLDNVTALFKNKKTLPFTADSALLARIKSFDSIGGAEVKVLDARWFKHELNSGVEYDLFDFYKIDSLKFACRYADWCEHLDIGMTKFSNAYAVATAVADDNTVLLFWGLTNSTFEACPYSAAETIYCSVLYKGEITQSFLLAENLSAGDPPVAMEQRVTGRVNTDGMVIIDKYLMHDEDMDDPFVFVTREHYEMLIKDGTLSLIKEEKGKPVKTPRKKEN